MKKLCAIAVTILSMLLFVAHAQAQSGGVACLAHAHWEVWLECMDYVTVPGMVVESDGSNGGISGCYIGYRSFKCTPDAAPKEVCITCVTAGAPISLESGNTFFQHTDIKQQPGLGNGIGLYRKWNSTWPSTQSESSVGIFGSNWRSPYEERIFLGSDSYWKYSRADGGYWSFGYDDNVTIRISAPANESVTLVAGDSYWTLTFKSGEKRLFDNGTGKLIKIIDRNGNTTQITYDSYGRIYQVTDPAARTLTFGYGGNEQAYLVVKVISSVGHVVNYTYDSDQKLISVTEPDGSVYNYEYTDANNPTLITAVKDAKGKVLESHTYDSSQRGTSSSRANGVESMTVTYTNQ